MCRNRACGSVCIYARLACNIDEVGFAGRQRFVASAHGYGFVRTHALLAKMKSHACAGKSAERKFKNQIHPCRNHAAALRGIVVPSRRRSVFNSRERSCEKFNQKIQIMQTGWARAPPQNPHNKKMKYHRPRPREILREEEINEAVDERCGYVYGIHDCLNKKKSAMKAFCPIRKSSGWQRCCCRRSLPHGKRKTKNRIRPRRQPRHRLFKIHDCNCFPVVV